MKWRWPPWRELIEPPADTSAEARAQMAELDRRDPEVQSLGKELRRAQRRNHFGEMVTQAISRSRENDR